MTKATLLGLLTVAAACSGDNHLEVCDIRDSTCQFEVFLAVQDVRGSLWDPWIEPPPMDVIAESEYRAQVVAEQERLRELTGVDYLTEGLKLLTMIDPKETTAQETASKVDSVAAYYDANAHHVTIIDRGDDEDQAVDVGTLAHELVHAAQGRDVGFGRLYRDVVTTNDTLALSALLEGEAVMYATLVDAKQRDVPKTLIDWRILAGWASNTRTKIFSDKSPYRIATNELLYPLGGMYMADAYVEGGPLAVRGNYDPPPLSTARYMAGRGTPGDVPVPAWSCGLVDPPSGFELVLGDELGAFALYAFATRFVLAEPQAWDRSRAWTGDRFYVYRNVLAPEELAVVWLIRCSDAQSATALHNSLAAVAWRGSLESVVRGDTLHVFASTVPVTEPYPAWMECSR